MSSGASLREEASVTANTTMTKGQIGAHQHRRKAAGCLRTVENIRLGTSVSTASTPQQRLQHTGLCNMRINCLVALPTKQTSYFSDSHFNIILQSLSRRWDNVRLRTGRSGVQIPAGQDISPPSGANAVSCSIDVVGSSAVGRPWFEVTSAYAKNEWSYTSTSHMPS